MSLRSIIRILVFWVVACLPFSLCAQEEHLVLIAARDSDITPLSMIELRRLFLGFPVRRGGRPVVPVLNRSSEQSYQVFLQAVMAMSARAYHRHLLRRFYRSGIRPPEEVRELKTLLDVVKYRPGAVTYVIRKRLPDDPDIKIVQELWRGRLR